MLHHAGHAFDGPHDRAGVLRALEWGELAIVAAEQLGGRADDAEWGAELVADDAYETGLEQVDLALRIKSGTEVFLGGTEFRGAGGDAFLKDLIEAAHRFLRLLEFGDIMVDDDDFLKHPIGRDDREQGAADPADFLRFPANWKRDGWNENRLSLEGLANVMDGP